MLILTSYVYLERMKKDLIRFAVCFSFYFNLIVMLKIEQNRDHQ